MVIDRPSLAVVHCWRGGQVAHAAPKVTVRAWLICRVIPAGQVTVPWPSSMVKSSTVNPPGPAGRSGPGVITVACRARALLLGRAGRGARLQLWPGARAGAVTGAAEPVTGGHLDAVLRIGAARPGGHRHLAVGDQPRARLGRHMPPEAVPALRLRLAGMPRLPVHGGDDPVRGDPAGDPP